MAAWPYWRPDQQSYFITGRCLLRYEEKLIQLAYELILEPSKLIELDELLDRKIHPELKNDEGFL